MPYCTHSISNHTRFLKTLPVVAAGAAGLGAVFLVPAAATPFLMVPMTVFFVDGAALAAVFLTTVVALPSLVSLLSLTLRAVRVAGLGGGALAGAAPRRVFAVVPAELELVFDVVVTLRVPPARVALAFSTMLESTLVAAAAERVAPVAFKGEAGRAIWDFIGEAGRSRLRRELDEVGDRICAGRTAPVSGARPRAFFLGFSMFSFSFSLSPEIPSLQGVRVY